MPYMLQDYGFLLMRSKTPTLLEAQYFQEEILNKLIHANIDEPNQAIYKKCELALQELQKEPESDQSKFFVHCT